MKWLKHWLIRYQLRHHPIPHRKWHKLMNQSPLFKGLTAVEKARLRELATLFLQKKNFTGAQQFIPSRDRCLSIAAQACLPVLNLSLDYYDGWSDIVLYPGAFKVERDVTDAIWLTSHESSLLGGEAWLNGPLILSWEQVRFGFHSRQAGQNVVIHELAHKIDMLNGKANGMPPLHASMSRQEWTRDLSHAYETLQRNLERRHPSSIDAYAATSPAEFFAVCSEYFFTSPQWLKHDMPDVYRQLSLFYRQDPLTRFS